MLVTNYYNYNITIKYNNVYNEECTCIILTLGSNLGGLPKCSIQFSRAPTNRITSDSFNALKITNTVNHIK